MGTIRNFGLIYFKGILGVFAFADFSRTEVNSRDELMRVMRPMRIWWTARRSEVRLV